MRLMSSYGNKHINCYIIIEYTVYNVIVKSSRLVRKNRMQQLCFNCIPILNYEFNYLQFVTNNIRNGPRNNIFSYIMLYLDSNYKCITYYIHFVYF